jgi:hypothetical protein
MLKTTTVLAVLVLAGCSNKGEIQPFSGSNNDSPIIVSDTSTTLGRPGAPLIDAIKVERQNVNFWSKAFYGDGNGHYQIHGYGPAWSSRYKAACVDAGGVPPTQPPTALPLDTPWSIEFMSANTLVFTITDAKGDNNEAIDPLGAALSATNKNTLITGTVPKKFDRALVKSGGNEIVTLTVSPVTVHYCPKGSCDDGITNPCK